jgi:hypothetical protein
MISSKIHIILRAIILIAVFLFSSGFTVIVKYCSMSQSSECCCCDNDHRTSKNEDLSINDQAPSCLTMKVIGGLSDTKATLTPESSTEMIGCVALLIPDDTILPKPSVLSIDLFQTDGSPPPGQEIYIRDAALLI